MADEEQGADDGSGLSSWPVIKWIAIIVGVVIVLNVLARLT